MSMFEYVNGLDAQAAQGCAQPAALPWWLGPLALGGLYLALLFTACAVSAVEESGS